jgi:membrane protein implicated in regulation of membrane protease activity
MLVLGYMVLAALGAGYILVSMLLGHLVDVGAQDPGAHAGADVHSGGGDYGVEHSGHGNATAGDGVAPAFHFPFFSPLALAALAGSIGGLGLVGRFGFKLADGPSLLFAVPAALVVTYLVTWMTWKVAMSSVGTSTIRADRLAGVPAEILTPIPAGGVGEAAALVDGQRFAGPAREVDGREVARGTPVTVVRLSGSTLVVKIAAR